MKGILLKDLYIAKSNILVTVISLIVLGFGLCPGRFHNVGFYQHHKRHKLQME